MKKVILTPKNKAEHKSDQAIWVGTQEVGTIEEALKNDYIKKQFAQDARIHQRVKCPVMAMVCCLMHQV